MEKILTKIIHGVILLLNPSKIVGIKIVGNKLARNNILVEIDNT